MTTAKREDEEYTFDKFDDGSNSKRSMKYIKFYELIFVVVLLRNGFRKSND